MLNTATTLRARPGLEALEDRLVLSSTISGGNLYITGTSASDVVTVQRETYNGVGYLRVYENGYNTYWRASAITGGNIVFSGGNGNDFFRNDTNLRAYAYGQAGDDVLIGGSASDVLYGGAGNDRLFGNAGYDYLFGEGGDDFLDDGNRYAQEYAVGGAGLDFNADVVAVGGTSMEDIRQNQAPTCSFLSSLAGLARRGYNLQGMIRYAGFSSDGTPYYTVQFRNMSSPVWVAFTGEVTTTDPTPAVEGESWVLLLQRAWIQMRGDNGACWAHEAIEALTGVQAWKTWSVEDSHFNYIAQATQAGRVVVAGTPYSPLTTNLLVQGHAYTVVATWGSGANAWVQVRNPWGVDGGAGSGNINDGLIWVRWADFKASMNYLMIL